VGLAWIESRRVEDEGLVDVWPKGEDGEGEKKKRREGKCVDAASWGR
jgi:hypothetical protein